VDIFSEWQLPGGRPLNQDEIGPDLESMPCHTLQEFEHGDPGRGEAAMVLVTSQLLELPPRGIFLRPPSLVAGIGCRRGVAAPEITAALEQALRIAGRSWDSLAGLASHQVKADERGLLEAAEQLDLGLKFFDSKSLEAVYKTYPGLQYSEFVQQQLGVGGVCETAALAAVSRGTLVLPKTKFDRVTVALAEAGWLWSASGREIRRI
jgi:cobalt-precorrin 5A hydrolase